MMGKMMGGTNENILKNLKNLNFCVFTVINLTNTDTNNPPNPPYIYNDNINYFIEISKRFGNNQLKLNMPKYNTNEISNTTEIINKSKKYKLYNKIEKESDIISLIGSNNPSTLIGSLFATDIIKNPFTVKFINSHYIFLKEPKFNQIDPDNNKNININIINKILDYYYLYGSTYDESPNYKLFHIDVDGKKDTDYLDFIKKETVEKLLENEKIQKYFNTQSGGRLMPIYNINNQYKQTNKYKLNKFY
jgi:hypothetical protein